VLFATPTELVSALAEALVYGLVLGFVVLAFSRFGP
jgi:hypothetical protein